MIKILIVEDDLYKSDRILSTLSNQGIVTSSVVIAVTVKDAIEHLSKNHYHLLILDLNLPLYSDSNAVENAGFTILKKIANDSIRTPDNIIALTSFDGLLNKYQDEFKSTAVMLLSYENDDWEKTIYSIIELIKKRNIEKTISSRDQPDNIAILVHGVMTDGVWQNKLSGIIKSDNSKVLVYKYKYYSPLKIAIPGVRKKQLSDFRVWLEHQFTSHPNAQYTIVAHSFGTYLSMIALDSTNIDSMIKINRIVLMGAVLKKDFSFERINKKFNPDIIINECGIKDIPLIFSKLFCIGLGHAGRVGFNSTDKVTNRYYNAGHSLWDDVENYYGLFWERQLSGQARIEENIILREQKLSAIESIFDILSPRITYPIILFIIFLIGYYLL